MVSPWDWVCLVEGRVGVSLPAFELHTLGGWVWGSSPAAGHQPGSVGKAVATLPAGRGGPRG